MEIRRMIEASGVVMLSLFALLASAQPAAATTVADATIDSPDPLTSPSYFSSSDGRQVSQAFTAINNGALEMVEVPLFKNASFTSARLKVFAADNNSQPTGAELTSQSILDLSVPLSPPPSQTPEWIEVDFSSPATMVAGQRYVLVLESASAAFLYWSTVDAPAFNGAAFVYTSSGTSSYVYSAGLRAFVNVSAPGPSGDSTSMLIPSDIYQQVGLAEAEGECSSFSRETLNWAGVGNGGWTQTWAQWLNDGQGGVVCSRTLGYSASLRSWIIR